MNAMPTFLDSLAGACAFRVEVCSRIEDLAEANAADHIKGLTLHIRQCSVKHHAAYLGYAAAAG
jgi:hypothetical protein